MRKCLQAEVHQYRHRGEAEADNPGVDFSQYLDGAVVFIVVQAQALEGRGEGVAQVQEEDDEGDEVEHDHQGIAEELAAHVVEVGLHAAVREGLLQHVALVVVDVAYPLAVFAEVALGDEVGHRYSLAQVLQVGLYLVLLFRRELVGIHGHLALNAGHHVGGRHLVLYGVLHQGVDLFALQLLHLDHVFALYPAGFDEVELAGVHHQEDQNQHTAQYHELRRRVSPRALALAVALGARQAVGNGEPQRQQDMQGDDTEQDDLEYLHHPVRAHEMAEGGVPRAVVMAQDEDVGRHVEQQEEEQECAHQGHKHLLRDGMDFG